MTTLTIEHDGITYQWTPPAESGTMVIVIRPESPPAEVRLSKLGALSNGTIPLLMLRHEEEETP